LSEDDFVELRGLHHRIVEHEPPGSVALESDAFLRAHLAAHGCTFGLFAGGRMIAYGIVGLSGPEHDHVADLLGLPSACRGELALLDGIGVASEHRGAGIHRMMNGERMRLADKLGRWRIGATAAPSNVASWRNLMADGLSIRALARMFGGYWRYVMLRDHGIASVGDTVWIGLDDLALQQVRLDGGYVGLDVRDSGGVQEIAFSLPGSTVAR
jgi:hypothetical protein